MKKHLVFVGGGHAHLTAMVRMKKYTEHGHQVTVISPHAYQYYSGMGPGMLSGIYRPQDIRFNIKKMTEDRGGVFIEDRVVRIDPLQRMLLLASERRIVYDVVSFNTGSEVPPGPWGDHSDTVYTVKPIFNLLRARKYIGELIRRTAVRVIVIGGGPAGVEVTGNIWRLAHDCRGKAEITLIAGKTLLGSFPGKVRNLTMLSFRERGITVVDGRHVSAINRDSVVLDDGTSCGFDVAFVAAGVRPQSLFGESGLPVGSDGGLLVNHHLQSVQYPEIFGGGDCISLEGHQLAKVGVYAVRENPILYRNIMASLDGGDLMSFIPQPHYLLIFNLGNNKGIFWRKNLVWHGRLAFFLKDYIDRKFMRSFQVSGERSAVDI